MTNFLEPAAREALAGELRERSRADYLHSLLLPPEARDAHLTLRRFHLELVELVRNAKEPQLAEIRLQWWADGILGLRANELASHPVGSALVRYVEDRPEARNILAAKVEAHSAELYADAPQDRHAFEELAGATRSVLLQLVVSEGSDASNWTTASGHAGVAEMVAERIASLPWFISKGFVPIPLDLLEEDRIAPELWLGGGEPVAMSIGRFARYGLDHLAKARAALPDGKGRRVFAKLRLHQAVLERAASRPENVAELGVDIGPLRMQWLLWRG